MRTGRAALFLALLTATPLSMGRAQETVPDTALLALEEEIAVAGILDRLDDPPQPERTIFRNVRIVDPVDERVTDSQSVLIANGRIASIVHSNAEPPVPGAVVIDGRGRFLAPGLTDMHIHSESASSWLLNLANGVTTVREMGGFPWLLATRDAINNGRLLGPNLYVAGTIINYYPLGGYAVVTRDAVNARRVVRQQAACGYDAIKVHNVMPRPVFDAIGAEARRLGMDFVGHVPHGMPVRDAVAAGMRTMEHLKGFLDDRTLQMGDTDYAAAAAPDVWVTPTLSGYLSAEPREPGLAELRSAESRYVPLRRRARWQAVLDAPDDDAQRLQRDGQVRRRQIVRSLVGKARFLAGTDGANYPFQVMGFVLLDELKTLAEAGVPPGEVLRAATSSPAAAMRAERDFGRIRPTMRADLVLLDRNPLTDPGAYGQNGGVMIRGRWLSPEAIDGALAELARLYQRASAPSVTTEAEAERLVQRAEGLVGQGFVFNARIVAEAAAALRAAGRAAAADRLAGLAVAPTTGPCAAIVR